MSAREDFDAAADRFRAFFDEFDRETDRGCAVLAMCVLEDTLRGLFQARVVEGADIRALAPPGNARAAVDNAVALGLLGAAEAQMYRKLSKIRNFFAHHALEGLTFESPEVVALTNSFSLPARLLNLAAYLEGLDSRKRFMAAASMVQLTMLSRTAGVTRLEVLAPLL